MKHLFLITIYLLSFTAVSAQKEWGDGEIKDVEIEIVKDRLITLPAANRLFEKIPPRPAEPIKPEIEYSFKAFTFTTPELNPVIRPLKLKDPQPNEAYRGYVSAGYGNYGTPYLEAFVTNKESKKQLIGAHAWLNNSAKGPVDGKNSGSGTMGITAFGQTFSKEVSVGGNIGFERRYSHFYGYPEELDVSRDSIKQTYGLFKMGARLANARNSAFSYQLGGDFSYISDAFKAKESTVDLSFKSAYKIADDNVIQIKADYSIISRKDEGVEAKPRNLFQVNGYYSFMPVDNMKLQVGATVALEDDTLGSKDFHFYPDLKITYPLTDAIDFVGSLSGGIEKVSLQTLANENIWLGPAVSLNHTNKQYDVQAGIRARMGGKVLAGAGISFASLKNMYFFVNDPTDVSKFQVAYDEGATKRTNFYASLLYTVSNVARVSVQGDYFAYSTDEIPDAWHKPTYRLAAGISYNLVKKFVFNVDMIAQGGMKALNPETLKTISVGNAFDLNFKTEYIISDTFSVFIDLNNITSNKYPMFLNYPVRGFQAMGGFTWKF